MKIWFRIGVERGVPRPPLQCRAAANANAEVRFLHPGRFSGARFLRPFTLLAPTSEGSSCEGERSSEARLSRPRRISRERFRQADRAGGTRLSAALPDTQKAAPATRKLLKNERFFAQWAPTSNRFWDKNRSYTKQRTKPRLTGTRIAVRDFGFLALFIKNSATNRCGSGDAHLACKSPTEHGSRNTQHGARSTQHGTRPP